jgi:hypothetical protein
VAATSDRFIRDSDDAAAIPIVGWEGRAQPSKSPLLRPDVTTG